VGIFDKLGDALKDYLKDGKSDGSSSKSGFTDPDMSAAYDELNEYLKTKPRAAPRSGTYRPQNQTGQTYSNTTNTARPSKPLPPESLRGDFNELGVEFGAGAEICKAAHKKLLKIHHPDKHTDNDYKKATEKTMRINASYGRIKQWQETGKI
jgi:DnaJ-domain-containing protein 1